MRMNRVTTYKLTAKGKNSGYSMYEHLTECHICRRFGRYHVSIPGKPIFCPPCLELHVGRGLTISIAKMEK